MSTIFGVEPVLYMQAGYVQKHDFLVIADGGATPTLELVHDVGEEDDEGNIVIVLMNQQSIKMPSHLGCLVARKGVNQNQ